MKAMDNGDSQPTVTAVLGPTNTGKTYLAVERMLGHASGMIGFPLRLLARENYDLVCRLRGKGCAALITGEERIVPAQPRYFLCTVEAMPLDRRVEFLAIDEIQLCADAERGHIFTDRLLHARGERETMLLGAETMAPAIRRLVPEAKFVRRPRFSQLSYTGRRKLARLPPRSAVVAFSASDVYALAELIRRQRGGAAVVMGALSPRTRNAQVGMYEAGEVDYLVATDAIGMGLNMDIDHVAFAAQVKFDGRVSRRLTPAEMAQIAGRAGRHMNDGTFGVTAREREIDAETVEAVEAHQFKPVGAVRWRNPALDFRSLDGLKRSLEMRPPGPSLVRSRDADDYVALAHLMNSAEIHDMATTPEAIRLLWDVCRIPNFDNAVEDTHASMLGRIYRFLRSNAGVVPAEYAARALDRLNRTDGDIDTLVARIARTRTWTYLSHRHQWFADAAHWQQWARTLEDKLSDALHDRLTQRFVDSHAGAVVRRMRARGHRLLGAIAADGTVFVEGHAVGRLEGMRFVLDDNEDGGDSDLLTSARRVIRDHIDARVAALERSSDPAFSLDENSRICWRDAQVARLAVGTEWLRPVVDVAPADLLEPHQRERVRRRLAAWLGTVVRQRLSALFAVADSSELGGAAARPCISDRPRGRYSRASRRDCPIARPDRRRPRDAGPARYSFRRRERLHAGDVETAGRRLARSIVARILGSGGAAGPAGRPPSLHARVRHRCRPVHIAGLPFGGRFCTPCRHAGATAGGAATGNASGTLHCAAVATGHDRRRRPRFRPTARRPRLRAPGGRGRYSSAPTAATAPPASARRQRRGGEGWRDSANPRRWRIVKDRLPLRPARRAATPHLLKSR